MPTKEEQYEQRQQQRQHHDAKNRIRGGKGQEQRAGVLQEKERSGRERQVREKGRPAYLRGARERDRGLAQKRANVDKIGGGSLQLLAGMSGNAWDSILKARPRQSPPSPPPFHVLLFSLSSLDFHQRLFRGAPTLYRVTPGIRRDYLIAWLDRRDHIAHLIRTTLT